MTSQDRKDARRQRRTEKRNQCRQAANACFDNYDILKNPDIYLEAFRSARKGVAWKHSVQYYEMYLLKNIFDTVRSVENKIAVTRGFVCFDINERGKMRHIKSPHICERVMQKALCDKCLAPILKRPLIYDNGACLQGKGTQFARKRIQRHLAEYYRKYGASGYVLTIDFSKYFDNIDHESLFQMLSEQIKDKTLLALTKYYVQEFGPVGLGLGSQVSQILAVFFPNKIDHFIKEKLRMRFYGRYMDDSYILCNSKEELQNTLKEITKLCEKYKIRLNPKKTRITPIKHGVDFLHCRYKFGRTGKIIKSGGRESLKRERRKLKKFRKKLDEGELDRKQIAEFYSSWRGFMQYFDSKTLLKNTDKLYNKLFIEG